MKKRHKLLSFFLILAFILAWSALLYFVGPDKLVELIGVQNGYLFVFLVASFGGFSSLTIPSLYATLATFTLGGLDPLLLGVVSGFGVTIGDSLFYLLGHHGRQIVSGRFQKLFRKIALRLAQTPRWLIPLVVFVYAGLTPLPNDILTISLAISKISWRRIIIPLLLGNIVLMTLIVLGTQKGAQYLESLPLFD